MAQINFDASQVNPSVPFEVLPSDKYLVEITKSEMKATKSGDGSYLELEYTVLDGAFKGRKVWDRLCLNHRTQKTVEIARANLSAICHAVGAMKPRESGELHHIPFVVTVKLKKEKDSENIFNEVKGYAKRVSVVTPPRLLHFTTLPHSPHHPHFTQTEIDILYCRITSFKPN